jgi:hypothetical protein
MYFLCTNDSEAFTQTRTDEMIPMRIEGRGACPKIVITE